MNEKRIDPVVLEEGCDLGWPTASGDTFGGHIRGVSTGSYWTRAWMELSVLQCKGQSPTMDDPVLIVRLTLE